MSENASELRRSAIEYNGNIFTKVDFNGISCIFTERYGAKYYNLSKVLKDNGRRRDLNDVSRNKYWKDFTEAVARHYTFNEKTLKFDYIYLQKEQKTEITSIENVEKEENEQTEKTRSAHLTLQKLKFEIKGNQVQNEINGLYFHEIFMNFFCEHIDLDYAVKVSRLMVLVNEELHLRNKTLEEKIKEMEEGIRKYKENINSGWNNEIPGSISFRPLKTAANRYKLKFSALVQEDVAPEYRIDNVFNVSKIRNLFNYYARNDKLPGIKYVFHNIIETENVENIKNAVKSIQNFTTVKDIKSTTIEEIKEFVSRKYHPNRDIKPKLFEYYCSLKYDIPMFKNDSTEQLGLTKADVGVDLIDTQKRIIGQCKYYKKSRLTKRSLSSFKNACKTYPEYEAFLYVNESCVIDQDVSQCPFYEIIRVKEEKYERWVSEMIKGFEEKYISKIGKTTLAEHKAWVRENIGLSHVPKKEFVSLFNERFNLTFSQACFAKAFSDILIIKDTYYELADETKHEKYRNFLKQYFVEHYDEKLIENEYSFDELYSRFNEHFRTLFSREKFRKTFSDILRFSVRFPNNHATSCVSLRNIEEKEEDFIIKTIGYSQIKKSEYLTIHNEHFKTNYSMYAFSLKFQHLFEKLKATRGKELQYKKVSINKKSVEIFEINEKYLPNKTEIFESFIKEDPNRENFNQKFHRFESALSFNKMRKTAFNHRHSD